MHRNTGLQIYFFCLLLLATGCSVTRHLEDDQVLLSKVKFEGVEDTELKQGLKDNLRSRPNKKILNFYSFYLQAYNFGLDGRDNNPIRVFFRENLGEKPSILDSNLLEQSEKQLKLYLFNNGYFNAEIDYTVKKKRKKAKVSYLIKLNRPYRVSEIEYRIYDKNLSSIIYKDTSIRVFKSGEIFDTEKLSDERERLTNLMRNNGYFDFTKDYIAFDVDSSQGNFTTKVAVEVRNPTLFTRHQTYTINEIYVEVKNPYFIPGKDDSLYHEVENINVKTNGYWIRPEVFTKYVAIRSGSLYRETQFVRTYNRFYDIQIFRTINIEARADTATRLINVFITLVPGEQHDFTIEPQAITSDQSSSVQSGNQRVWGAAAQIQYRNKNALRGAEVFEVRLGSSAEFQYTQGKFVYSNFEQSVSALYTVPDIFFLKRNSFSDYTKSRGLGRFRNPQTVYNLTFIYENNQDYVRRVALFNYNWSATLGYSFLRFVPIEITLNQVNMNPNSDLLRNLDPGERVLLSNLLNTNFIPADRLEWIYSEKGKNKSGHYIVVKANVIERAGNVLTFVYKNLLNKPRPDDGVYEIFNTDFYQYLKTDWDLRYYQNPLWPNRLALRARAGLAYPIAPPLGNSSVIPFEKRFFIGGATSLRGWRPRSVGPGEYNDPLATQIDRSGEIVMEGSAELRFTMITNFLEGALFLDGGNIWTVNADSTLKGAQISWQFYDQFALNTGFGLRFNFSFFIVRFDLGMQLRDPSYIGKNHYVINDYNYLGRRMTLNFGIGYPF